MKNIVKKLLIFVLSFGCLFNQSFTVSHAQEKEGLYCSPKNTQYDCKLKSNEGDEDNEESDEKTFFQKFKIGLAAVLSFIATCGFVKWIYDISKKQNTDEVHQGETNSLHKSSKLTLDVSDDASGDLSSNVLTPASTSNSEKSEDTSNKSLTPASTPPLEESSDSSSKVLTPASASTSEKSEDTSNKDLTPASAPPLEASESASTPISGESDKLGSSVSELPEGTPCDDVLECVRSCSHFESIRDGILGEYLSKTSETKGATALAKLNCSGSVMIIGDVHGDIAVLNNYLIKEVAEHLQKDPNNAIVVLGDMVDAKDPLNDNSIYVLLYFLNLWNHYPDRVVLLRGNHEDAVGKIDGGFNQYPWREPQCGMWDKKLEDCLSQLPLYCEITLRDVKFFAVHGNINLDFINAIDRDDLDDELPGFPKWPIYSDCSRVPGKSADPEQQQESLDGRFGLTNNHLCMTGDPTPGGYYGQYIDITNVTEFCFKYGYSGLFRGHDPYYENIFVSTDPQVAAFTIHTSDNGKYTKGPRIAQLNWVAPNVLMVNINYLKRNCPNASDLYKCSHVVSYTLNNLYWY